MMGLPNMISSLFRGNAAEGPSNTGPVTVYEHTEDPTKAWEILSEKQTVKKVKLLPRGTPVHKDKVRFVCMSDTHNRMPLRVDIPEGDVFLHAGDFTMVGQPKEVEAFNDWLGTLPYKHKIVVAGNHDLTFDDDVLNGKLSVDQFGVNVDTVKKYMKEKGVTHMKEVLTNCTYLQDSETSVYGIRIYGSPWQPEFCDWGFNLPRGQPCLDKWNQIPEGVDILITHGPPIGHGDLCTTKQRAGCVELLHSIQQRVKCRYHVFGHIHEGYGITSDGTTTYINASTCTSNYRSCNQPIIFDIPLPPGVTKEDVTSGSQKEESEGAAANLDEEQTERTEEEMEVGPEAKEEEDKGPLVLNQEYNLEATPAPHSSTSTEFRK